MATGSSRDDLAEAAVLVCRRLLGIEAQPAASAGPLPAKYKRRHMNSIRLTAGATTLFASRRRDAEHASREAEALRALAASGAPVPKLLAVKGSWLIQEDVGQSRLTQKLRGADESKGIALLRAAAEALWRCQEAGAKATLKAGRAYAGGYDRLLAAPGRVGNLLKAPPPKLAAERVLAAIHAPESVFIKWDARPANAIVAESGAIFWIDWEEWGRRCRLDDLVWLLCDEWVPEWPDGEERLMAQYANRFSAPFAGGARAAIEYVAAFGALHAIVRLEVILKSKAGGPWWDEEICLVHDLMGVTPGCVLRLLSRAARLAAKVPALEPLAAWLHSLPEKLPE